jgi:hypothetical protein
MKYPYSVVTSTQLPDGDRVTLLVQAEVAGTVVNGAVVEAIGISYAKLGTSSLVAQVSSLTWQA